MWSVSTLTFLKQPHNRIGRRYLPSMVLPVYAGNDTGFRSDLLEVGRFWCSREGDDIPYIGHTAQIHNSPLKTESKAGMLSAAKFP